MFRAACSSCCCSRIGIVLLATCFWPGPAVSAQHVPVYTVTVNSDLTNGSPGNCTDQSLSGATPDASCSLRDALAASEITGAKITFSASVFSTPQTITIANSTLDVPSNTTITGITSGSVPNVTNLVTVSGNQQFTVFTVLSGAANVAISYLNISEGFPENLSNDGVLTLGGCSVSGAILRGISNGGTLAVLNSNISGTIGYTQEFPQGIDGGGISNGGTAKVVNSTIEGNNSTAFGGGIYNTGTLTLADSTVMDNTIIVPYFTTEGGGAGIFNEFNAGPLVISNSLLADNTIAYAAYDGVPLPDDCGGANCPVNGVNGNVVDGYFFTPFTLPGGATICGGLLANIPAGVTTDQRGVPRTTTYSTSSGNVICVDTGAIQTHYSLIFSTEPPASVGVEASFMSAVQLSESGSPFPVSGVSIPLTLAASDSGTLSGGTASTKANSVATYSNLLVSAPGSDDMLVATLPLTTTPPPGSLTAPISINATSSSFNARQEASRPVFSLPSGTYTSPQSVAITDATPGATIYYTTNGVTPDRSSPIYTSPITVSSTETIRALAVDSGDATSPEGVAAYTIIAPPAATPVFSTATGFYLSTRSVTITDTTPGATIYYTTNDTTPTTSSTKYVGSITVSSTERLEAIAVAPNYSPSAVAIATYGIAAAEPAFSRASGTYTSPQMVTITDATPGAIIHYTTDGTLPSRSSPIFSSTSPIIVSSTGTIRALAVAAGYDTSPEGVAIYTITP